MTATVAPVVGTGSRADVAGARRVVVKIGSSSLTGADGLLDVDALHRLVEVLAARRADGTQVVLVTSGAIAAGVGPSGCRGAPRTSRPPRPRRAWGRVCSSRGTPRRSERTTCASARCC
ncbi:hypothetical protein GCM10025864_31730 [Luteimicrobium album]|uniref:Aspartate/glutamate/uridylate kinase domain-containing protein n=1 Tax=Luteimicrobium album TaxID=1054550 RepID=A0ABQ6I6K8_9MICO|nr:hypothetical protein GCM10025864_31730 [Luteimicrobium album]